MLGGDRIEGLDAEAMEFVQMHLKRFAVDLVDHEKDRLGQGPQDLDHFPIVRRHPGPAVQHQHHGIGIVDGHMHLLADLGGKGIFIRFGKAAGVHQGKHPIVPGSILVNAITGHPRKIIHQGVPASGHPVEEGRFAHIGPANDGHDGFGGHGWTSFNDMENSLFSGGYSPWAEGLSIGGAGQRPAVPANGHDTAAGHQTQRGIKHGVTDALRPVSEGFG